VRAGDWDKIAYALQRGTVFCWEIQFTEVILEVAGNSDIQSFANFALYMQGNE
jgi:hypothetical protein